MSTPSAQLEVVGIEVLAAQPDGAAVGLVDDATQDSAVLLGKRVLVPAFEPCGQCDICRRGGAAVCPAGTRRGPAGARIRASTRWLVALADGLELPVPAAAAVAGDVTTAYTLYARTGLSAREPVVIAGDNAVTRFLVEILRAKGITPVVVVGRDAPAWSVAWREWLFARGAAAVSGGEASLPAAVAAAIAAQGQGQKPLRLIATEASALPVAESLAGPRATLTVLARGELPALSASLLAREVSIVGVAGPHPDLVVEAAAMCVKGEIDLAAGIAVGGSTDPTRAHVIVPA